LRAPVRGATRIALNATGRPGGEMLVFGMTRNISPPCLLFIP